MRKIAVALCVALCLLLTGCGSNPRTVTPVTRLWPDRHTAIVELSDGALFFEDGASIGTLYETPPKDCKFRAEKLSYEEFVAYIGFDPMTLDGVPTHPAPSRERVDTLYPLILEDYRVTRRYTMKAGTVHGGAVFYGYETIDETRSKQSRGYEVVLNKGDAFNYLAVTNGKFVRTPNSMVGEIPVYVGYSRCTPALEWRVDTDMYVAAFQVGGYSCGIYMDGYTQEEFVDLLLAIINHYGAYPSQAG